MTIAGAGGEVLGQYNVKLVTYQSLSVIGFRIYAVLCVEGLSFTESVTFHFHFLS